MTTRERWIVYPLLFLTLGIVWRDKMIPPVHRVVLSQEIRATNIRCGGIEAKEAEFKSLSSDKIRWKVMELGGAAIPLRLTLPGEDDGGGKPESPN